jgi:hypothetical protein
MNQADVTNNDRAEWAIVALNAFGEETGQSDYDYTDTDQVSEIVGDLICNLLHVLDRAFANEQDVRAVIARGIFHWEMEKAEEES